jgi:acyl-CoA reductase-like NAD-dependent aldehyde dehydrogenase
MKRMPFWLAGEARNGQSSIEVRSPWDGQVIGSAALAGTADVEAAIAAGAKASGDLRRLAAYRRAEALVSVARSLRNEKEAIARTIALEAGKPIRDARVEVERASITFETAAEEAKRIEGRWLPLDGVPAGAGRSAIVRRVPIGLISGISPYNYPLNLAAHKLAPAIAAGCPIVLKPATRTPLSALRLGELLSQTELPQGSVSVLPASRTTGEPLVTDGRIRLLTFTGSPAVGWPMRARAGRKRVVLELGGNAGVVIDETADVAHAISRIVAGAFHYGGQSCISTQRVYCVPQVFDQVVAGVAEGARALVVGDPLDERTDVGPLIDEAAAVRVERWIADAEAGGGTVVVRPDRDAATVRPSVVVEPPAQTALVCEEAFGPVVSIFRVPDIAAGLAAIDTGRFGLQAGVFTSRVDRLLAAFGSLEVGAVLLNDVPSWRVDPMPYGGVKESGLGREGPRWAIEDMTEPRMLILPA